MPHTTGRGNCSRQTSARFRPVAMPSLAESDWISIAIRLRGDDHPDQHVPELGPALDVGGEVAGIDVGDAGDEGRAEERRQPLVPGLPALAGENFGGCRADIGVAQSGRSGYVALGCSSRHA